MSDELSGRVASQPGCRPSDGAASVSAVPASIPRAEDAFRQRVHDRIGDILGSDPACVGRVTTSTLKRLTQFVLDARNDRRASPPNPERFYLVWSPDGPTEPKKKHLTHREAAKAAWDMAERHPSQIFYILKKTGKPASGIAARSDETAQQAQPEGQEPDPKGDAR